MLKQENKKVERWGPTTARDIEIKELFSGAYYLTPFGTEFLIACGVIDYDGKILIPNKRG